jgi:uncharacterized protein YpmB
MRKSEEYFDKIPYNFDIPNIKEWICDQIKQAQEDAIREAVKQCAESAETKSFKLSKYSKTPRWKVVKDEEEVDLFSYDFKTEVNKKSILSVADKLIKEL